MPPDASHGTDIKTVKVGLMSVIAAIGTIVTFSVVGVVWAKDLQAEVAMTQQKQQSTIESMIESQQRMIEFQKTEAEELDEIERELIEIRVRAAAPGRPTAPQPAEPPN